MVHPTYDGFLCTRATIRDDTWKNCKSHCTFFAKETKIGYKKLKGGKNMDLEAPAYCKYKTVRRETNV